MGRMGLSIMKIGFRASLLLVTILIWYKPEASGRITGPDLVSLARARFVLVTSDCLLGSGFLTGYREGGKAEVITAYHLVRCGQGNGKRQSSMVRADGVAAEMSGADPQHDLLRLLVPLPITVTRLVIRTECRLDEPVFAVGSNPQGDRAAVTWGTVLLTPPGEVTAKVTIAPGTSSGQLISGSFDKAIAIKESRIPSILWRQSSWEWQRTCQMTHLPDLPPESAGDARHGSRAATGRR